MLTPLQALTADAALRAILQLRLLDWRNISSARNFIRAALLKQPFREETRERCIAELHPLVLPALERMCSVSGLPMKLMGSSAFASLGKWPPDQVRNAVNVVILGCSK